ncbi:MULTISPECIES: FKBP-type peptidyl-prolyl cis-trans isomerase N-terminal domain-containing protein [Serratia]|uniref:FKBP-type peptidyl-prolyl cis-trans isomerase N-terminal domain-containing protein n=1 Tax=Serratia TaxID=613 RepID=UPI002177DD33|nr:MULTISPECIES: FKBP-type peptidyl-prolyl cis-trans isomerase N-terminal domain-containing protein [Serratia]MDI6930333.1 FKBP-type peptidyl-prolyl cis-trans isomerase N-terminal domain-containing protein [Serratia sp. Se-PFBMAAmG]MDI6973942.1 FKBP-type peptidyl-prolyl cis-trans isomerase N-terminal domain-containing protein [Serratia sp. Se-RSBMAAmG]MDI9262926.1 FKBP-type peptidyl-prolyl cis-trans isomerase N-terminal domain-containing protein [Serratia sp. PF2-63]MDI9268113.1 FKBP-type pepti
MTLRARKALLSLMIALAFAPAVVAADDDVPALLQFAERYQRQDAPAADTAVTQSQAPQKSASRPVQTRETAAHKKQLAQWQKALREKEARLEQQQAVIQSLQQELTALRVASTLTAADKPSPAPDLSALSNFASGVRQALNLTPQERKAQAQIAETQAALARQKQQTAERDRRIALLEQRLAVLPGQADNAWQEKLAAVQTAHDKARQRYEQDKKAAVAELEQQKAEAARLTGELQQQLAKLQKEQVDQRQQGGQQEQSLKTALAQQKAETAKAAGELQQQLAQVQKERDIVRQQAERQEKSLKTALAQQKAEAAKAAGELQQQLAQVQKERDIVRQQAEQQEKSLKTALAQQKVEAAKAAAELQQQLTQLQKERDGQRQQAEQQEQNLKMALAQQKAEAAKATGELQQQLATLQGKNKTQTEQAKALEQRLAALTTENAQTVQLRNKAAQQADKTATELAAAQQAQQALREELDGLRSRAKWLPESQTLKKKPEQQSYAAGVALGRDIQTMLAERKNWGITPDKTVLLAGVIDTFSGHYQLSDAQLTSALAESEKAVNDARNQAAKTQTSKGEAFVAEFKKKKGTQKSPAGFWYRIDYAGDEAIKENARVDIVVKESLTDGRVIQDMDRSGKVMSQPLSAYPPLFREAIGHLKNHGSLTMVVPPALAYGETGYAPQIPPNATMVYELRIVDVSNG